MAKAQPSKLYNQLIDGWMYKKFAEWKRGSLQVTISKNQHSLTLQKKQVTIKSRSEKQQETRGRFKQLECMWKLLTPQQRSKWKQYTQEYNNSHKEKLRAFDLFKKLGLEYKLNDFLTQKLCASYNLILVEETDEYYLLRVNLSIKPPAHLIPPAVRALARLRG